MGPQFFETRMGQKFFEGDVPRLLKTLQRIADALERGVARDRANLLSAVEGLRVNDDERRGLEPLRQTWAHGFNDALSEVIELIGGESK